MESETGDPSSKSGRYIFLSLRVNAIGKIMNPSSTSYELTLKTYEALLGNNQSERRKTVLETIPRRDRLRQTISHYCCNGCNKRDAPATLTGYRTRG